MAERFGDYSSAVNRVSQNLRALLPDTTAAGMNKRTPSFSSYLTQRGQAGGYTTQRGGVGGYQTNAGTGLLGYKGANPQVDLFSFLNAGPKSYQQMLSQNQFNPNTAVGEQTQSNQNAAIGGGNLAGTVQWQDLMKQAGTELNVPWQVLASIMAIESQGINQNDPGGAVGLMQIMPQYWSQLAQQYGGNLQDPRTNIFTAAAILRQNYERYGSWESAAAAYFGGAGAFNEDGSYSDASDSYNTDIETYVAAFTNYMNQLQYNNPTAGEVAGGGQAASTHAATALQNAIAAQGTPYVWGGKEPGGFDCSGLISWAYGQAGVDMSGNAATQYNNTQRITSAQLQPGDLIFFMFPEEVVQNGQGGTVNHVAMYAGNGQFIQASSNGSVVGYRSLYDEFYSQYMFGFGRVG